MPRVRQKYRPPAPLTKRPRWTSWRLQPPAISNNTVQSVLLYPAYPLGICQEAFQNADQQSLPCPPAPAILSLQYPRLLWHDFPYAAYNRLPQRSLQQALLHREAPAHQYLQMVLTIPPLPLPPAQLFDVFLFPVISAVQTALNSRRHSLHCERYPPLYHKTPIRTAAPRDLPLQETLCVLPPCPYHAQTPARQYMAKRRRLFPVLRHSPSLHLQRNVYKYSPLIFHNSFSIPLQRLTALVAPAALTVLAVAVIVAAVVPTTAAAAPDNRLLNLPAAVPALPSLP